MHIEPLPSLDEVIALLAECALPTEDILPSSPPHFFGIRLDGALAAVVGLELHRPFGLLRSLAVAPAFRHHGYARELVAFAESFAAAHGIEALFLLTTAAERFFLALGYSPAARHAAPPAIQATSQFSQLCPASSAFLCKHVAANDPERS